MNSLPGVVVGFWGLPMVIYAFIPLLLLCLIFGARITSYFNRKFIKRSRVTGFRHEKRAHRRIYADDMSVDVSDGETIFNGLVCDISKLGICIMGIPEKLFGKADRLAVVVDSHGETYALNVMPRWQRTGAAGRQIGASIEYAPDGWYEFVKNKGSFVQPV